MRGIFTRTKTETRSTIPIGVSPGDHKYWNIALQHKWLRALHCRHVKWFWQEVGSGFGLEGVHYFYDKLHPHKQPDGYYFYYHDPDFQKLLNYVDYISPHFITSISVETPIQGMGSSGLPWTHDECPSNMPRPNSSAELSSKTSPYLRNSYELRRSPTHSIT